MSQRHKPIRQTELFDCFDSLLQAYQDIKGYKKTHQEVQVRKPTNDAYIAKRISFAENDVYDFSVRRNTLKQNLEKVDMKLKEVTATLEDREAKFLAASDVLTTFEHKTKIFEVEAQELE